MSIESKAATGPRLLKPKFWDLASARMPGREVQYVLQLGIINDVNQKNIDGRHFVTVVTDIVNYYPNRVSEIDGALLAALRHFKTYLAQEIAGKIASRFDEFPLHEDSLKRQQLQHIREVLSDFADSVEGPNLL